MTNICSRTPPFQDTLLLSCFWLCDSQVFIKNYKDWITEISKHVFIIVNTQMGINKPMWIQVLYSIQVNLCIKQIIKTIDCQNGRLAVSWCHDIGFKILTCIWRKLSIICGCRICNKTIFTTKSFILLSFSKKANFFLMCLLA